MSTPRTLDPVTAELDRALRSLAGLGGDLVSHANRLAPIVWSPPRVVVVGRLKAGKSTLVNALVGEKIAATGALEVTSVLSVFHYGTSARAEVFATDGRVYPAPLVDGVVSRLPVPVDAVTRVDRYLPSAAIRDMTLIDTPGLGTLTAENEERARRALLPGYDQTRRAAVGADAAIFVFESLPRAYERDFVAQLGFTPLNTLGVLARADGFGEGAMGRTDPLDNATAYAGVLAERLRNLVSGVVPSCGLMAEAVFTGQVTERVAAALARLGELPRRDLFRELEAESPERMSVAERDELIELIGEYGVIHGAGVAAQGGAALTRWLETCSGIHEVRARVHDELMPFAALQRALRLDEELRALAVDHPAGEQIRRIAATTMAQTSMAKVSLFRAYAGLIRAEQRSRLTPVLRRALEADRPSELLGLGHDASPERIAQATRELRGQIQQMQFVGTSAAEDEACGALSRYLDVRGMRG